MRILIVGSTYFPQINGQSVFTQNLAEGMTRLGHEVMVVFPSDTQKPYSCERNGVSIHTTRSLKLTIVHPALYVAHSYHRLVKRLFDTFQPDVIHCQDSAPLSQYMIRVAHAHKIKTIGTNHPGPEIWSPYFSSIAFLMRLGFDAFLWGWILSFLNQSDFVTVPSQAAASLLKSHGLKAPVRAISCGVNLNQFKPLPDLDRAHVRRKYGLSLNRKVFVYIGRLDTEKKVDVLVKAAAKLTDAGVEIAIAGTGAEEKNLQALAAELGVSERVKFTGLVQHNDLPELLNAADAFVMPGDVESLSIATLEAMACGRPIVAANSMALPELVSEGQNGYLFRPGSAHDAARCIDRLAQESEKWAEMGRYSLQRAAAHSISAILQAYERVYLELIGAVSGTCRYTYVAITNGMTDKLAAWWHQATRSYEPRPARKFWIIGRKPAARGRQWSAVHHHPKN